MNLKKKKPAFDSTSPARLSLSDFATRDNVITSNIQLTKVNGGEADAGPRPPLLIITR
ncbi:hypothetical protein [Dinghuibacter silviterrae]|uniref:Uncharacterized protein n=1 Tax=Dinghuibacter silviterrae TaxID=1539049 RepID=A0A4R8DGN8_9BACT|nr:hypothetical protein [Dinghuibacter silviterrae]TDW96665.1 hypothetical protein EDB95_4500 [Dinghuibacter silviterrae]